MYAVSRCVLAVLIVTAAARFDKASGAGKSNRRPCKMRAHVVQIVAILSNVDIQSKAHIYNRVLFARVEDLLVHRNPIRSAP